MQLNCTAETNLIDSTTVSIKYIVGGWLTLLFCVSGKRVHCFRSLRSTDPLGIITNIFTVVVLLHPRMRNSSTHVYLMALSACNIFLLLGLMINYSLKSIGKMNALDDALSLFSERKREWLRFLPKSALLRHSIFIFNQLG